jgi:hypothetical protein
VNQEKLKIFIQLIEEAIRVAEEQREIMKTQEFYQKCKEAGWVTQEDIELGREHLEQKYDGIFHYLFLDRNIIQGLKNLKQRAIENKLEGVESYPKGQRGNFGYTRGISDYEGLWGDELYDCRIYRACGAVESYYNMELE